MPQTGSIITISPPLACAVVSLPGMVHLESPFKFGTIELKVALFFSATMMPTPHQQ
jgi:hypothetical protein